MNKPLTITWLGHGTFLFETPGGKRVLFDPWFDNPKFPDGWRDRVEQDIDLILVSHGHFDHIGNLVEVAQKTGAKIGCIFDMTNWLQSKDVTEEQLMGFNKGGTIEVAGLRVTMTDAKHSSGFSDDDTMVYMGEPAGYVIEFEDGYKLYHSGDTAIFGDMKLIGELYQPDVALLPIGDFFTMGPYQAAQALKLLGVPRCIPEHYGTFPLLTGTPAMLREELRKLNVSTEVIDIQPGDSWSPTS